MNELTLEGKVYVSSKQAAEMTGYAKDYVGQLCREGRLESRLVGRNWYVLKAAIEKYRFGTPEAENGPLPVSASNDPWGVPRYQAEELEMIPSINRLVPAKKEIEIPETTKVAVVHAELSATEPEPENGIAIPIHHILEENRRPIVDLAEPRNTINKTSFLEVRENTHQEKKGGNRVIFALLVVIILASILTAYVGTGYSSGTPFSYTALNFIAGVSTYTSSH